MPLPADSLHLDTALYYTFSTIAQTLAAAVSLLAVFVVFLFQTLHRPMSERMKELSDAGWYTSKLDKDEVELLLKAEEFEAMAVKFKGPWGEPHKSRIEGPLQILNAYLTFKDGVTRQFKLAAVASSCVMVGAVIALAITPFIAKLSCLAIAVLLIGAVSFAGCLGLCVRVVRAALEKPLIRAKPADVAASTAGGVGEAGR